MTYQCFYFPWKNYYLFSNPNSIHVVSLFCNFPLLGQATSMQNTSLVYTFLLLQNQKGDRSYSVGEDDERPASSHSVSRKEKLLKELEAIDKVIKRKSKRRS